MRLNKYLAHSGVGSRRFCDTLVFEGRVQVNGSYVDTPAIDVNEQDRVLVDGERVRLKKQYTYIKLNKPRGYVSTTKDPYHEKIVTVLLPKVLDVVPVGRLDKDTTGILIFTDDGDLLHKLIHPKYGIEKEYEVLLEMTPQGYPENELHNGIRLENGDRAKGIAETLNEKRTHYKVILKEGKKREVKRIFRHYNSIVRRLHRNLFAGISANELAEGKWKKLTPDEIKHLKKITNS
ncbi:MAG: rRNA pseudouridine synthase [Candidatus Marinimicrobia bacterium]|nr:rRNA pseudouridine synthase [Candidatus Neomarinimicrobiota bacterium]